MQTVIVLLQCAELIFKPENIALHTFTELIYVKELWAASSILNWILLEFIF